MKKIIYIITIAIMFLFIPYKVMAGQTTITSSGYYCSSNGFATSGGDYTCASGTIFPSGSGELCSYDQTQCNKNTSTPQCPSGYTWNGSSCVSTVSASCPSGYTYDSSTGQCTETTTSTTNITASGGWSGDNTSEVSGGDSLLGVTANGNTLTFYYGSYNSSFYGSYYVNSFNIYLSGGTTTTSISTTSPTCPSGYTLSGNTCTSTTSATCPSGTTLANGECVSYSCPLGGSTQCIEPSGSSTYYCSPQSCYNLNYNNGTISIVGSNSNTQSMPSPQTNNGTVSSNGCSGSVSIFAGVAEQCRSGGIQTAYHDCCNAGTYLFGAIQCNSSEKTVAKSLTYDQNYGNTVYPNANYTGGLEGEDIYVGSYCSDSFLGWCLERMDVFCQFPGLLAATIQQQGRAQIGLSWGSAQSPNCNGFTPNQLQELNFSSMNLSTLTNVLTQTAIAQAKTTLSNNLSSTTQSIKNEINQTMSGQ